MTGSEHATASAEGPASAWSWRWALLAGLLYYLSARFGMAVFALQPSNITLLWLPSGIALVLAVRLGWRAFALILLASFAANYPGMSDAPSAHPALHVLISALADALAPCMGAQLLRWRMPAGLVNARSLGGFSLYACLLPTLLGGVLIAGNLVWGGYIAPAAAGDLLRSLVIADSLGILLAYPLYQAWRDLPLPTAQEWGWLLLAGLCNLAALLLAFNGYSGFIYFVLPVLLMLTFRIRQNGVYLVLLFTVVGILGAAARDLGPFQDSHPAEARFMLMAFVFTITFVCLSLAMHYHQLLESDASRLRWQAEALHDALTGLLNRRGFMPILLGEHQRVSRTRRPYALALLDLDHFKQVNDRHGHAAGDAVLVMAAQLMQARLRDIDTLARIGGEEFVILFPESSAAEAAVALERIRQDLQAQPVLFKGQSIGISVSIGVVEFEGGPQGIDELLAAADANLYAAKSGGRNRLVGGEGLRTLAG